MKMVDVSIVILCSVFAFNHVAEVGVSLLSVILPLISLLPLSNPYVLPSVLCLSSFVHTGTK